MMNDFSGLMNNVIEFTGHKDSNALQEVIKSTDKKQKSYISKHKYNLSKFGLSEEKIKEDCKAYYETFIN